MIWLLALAVSLFSSVIGSISGIGGGIIMKPVLDAAGFLSVSAASFLSGCTVLTMSAVSLLRGRKTGPGIDRHIVVPLAVGAVAGGLTGKWLFDLLIRRFEEARVGLVQSAVLLLLTLFVFFFMLRKDSLTFRNLRNVCGCVLVGACLGLLSSFLGIGGGPMNIAVLYYFFSMDSKTAAKSSLFIILFSQISNLGNTLVTGGVPLFDPAVLLLMALGGVTGGILGTRLVTRMSGEAVERFFRGILCLIMLINVWNIVKFGLVLAGIF